MAPAEPPTEHVPLLIVGGGPAGYTAALYAARFGLEPLCLEGYDSGGQIARSMLVENFPGIADGTSGADLSARVREQAERFGARIVMDEVVTTTLVPGQLLVRTASVTYRADALVIATGSRPRQLGLSGEDALVGRGIAYCALCDGAFFAGQDVVVVGGGNAALDEALAMARLAARVRLVHRRDSFRADAILEATVRADPRIQVLTPHVVEALVDDDDEQLCGIQIRDLSSGERSYLSSQGLFIAIGHEPASSLFTPAVATQDGRVITHPGSTATSVPGVFAAGDVADSRYRQAVTAAASGCMAAVDAQRWLASGEWPATATDPELATAVH